MSPTSVRLDMPAFLESANVEYHTAEHRHHAILFDQGDACEQVFYVQRGRVELSALSYTGQVAVFAVLGPGDFFGEAGLAGQLVRRGRARTMTACTILSISTTDMRTLLHTHHAFSGRFLTHLLARQSRSEADLIDHMIHSAEKRLARVLWLLAGPDASRTVPPITQQTLADMVGTGRSRTNILLQRLKRRGLIDSDGERITVNDALGLFVGLQTPRPALASAGARPDRKMILLVDDESSVRTTVGQMLEHSGYRVLVAGVSEEACALFEDHLGEVDLLLTDVVMPDMSGVALAERLSARKPGLPVLLMSGQMTTVTVPAAQAPRTGFLEKPFRIPALTSAVSRLLETCAAAG